VVELLAAGSAAFASSFVVCVWLTQDGGSADAGSRAQLSARAADSTSVVAESTIQSHAPVRLASLGAGDGFGFSQQGDHSETILALTSFSERFAFELPDAALQASLASASFDDRFGGEGRASEGRVQSAAAASGTTVARAATAVAVPRPAPRAVAAKTAPKRGPKAGYQLASAGETSISLGYAPADAGIGSGTTGSLKGLAPKESDPLADVDASRTAIYDITSHMVYLPNGRRLEAHSGLGSHMDDPRSVSKRMVGATPPNVYDLKMRESLFHGVRAIRLVPKDDSKMYGRDGILAHTYMLGPNGQSNGCVSFSDYSAFLAAYERGEITRLVVVEHLADAPTAKTASDWFSNTLKDIFRRS
jgi:Tlde1 domain